MKFFQGYIGWKNLETCLVSNRVRVGEMNWEWSHNIFSREEEIVDNLISVIGRTFVTKNMSVSGAGSLV